MIVAPFLGVKVRLCSVIVALPIRVNVWQFCDYGLSSWCQRHAIKVRKDCLWKQGILNHENRRLGFIESLHMQHCSLRGCIRTPPAPSCYYGSPLGA